MKCLGCMKDYSGETHVCPHCGYVENTLPKEAFFLYPGTLVNNRYTIGKAIGNGGFGVTYIAWDNLLTKTVAIKEYLPVEFSTRIPGQTKLTIYDGERADQFRIGKERFIDEARKMAQFQNVPGIVSIQDSFLDNNTAYIAMEYLDGVTLKDRLAKEKKLPKEDAVQITLAVISALKVLHDKELYHRDIAPDNIILTNDGRVVLIDFGAAKFATTTHSKSLSVIVKEGYTPKEQYGTKGTIGPWSDVYSLGATLYAMVTGITLESAMDRSVEDHTKAPSSYCKTLTRGEENAILNAINVLPGERTQTAAQFEEELLNPETKRVVPGKIKKDVGKIPAFVKWAGGILATLVIVMMALILSGVISLKEIIKNADKKKVTVPNLVGISQTAAEEELSSRGLYKSTGGGQYNNTHAATLVYSQSIESGENVPEKSVVEIKYSLGRYEWNIQDIISKGQTRVDLEKEFNEDNKGPKNIIWIEEENAAPIGSAFRSEPEVFYTGDESVTIYISTGISEENRTVIVPDVIHCTVQEATAKLGEAELNGIVDGIAYVQGDYRNTIEQQSPAAGTEAKVGEKVHMAIFSSYFNLGNYVYRDDVTVEGVQNELLSTYSVTSEVYEIRLTNQQKEDAGKLMEIKTVDGTVLQSKDVTGIAEVSVGAHLLLGIGVYNEPVPTKKVETPTKQTVVKYTIKFFPNADDVSGLPSAMTKEKGKDVTLPGKDSPPTRKGYTFKGWSKSEGANNNVDYAAGTAYSGNANINLYAVWQLKKISIKFNANGGTGAPSNMTKSYGDEITLSQSPTWEYHTFKGWATSQENANNKSVKYAAGQKIVVTSNLNLYAVWDENGWDSEWTTNTDKLNNSAYESQQKTQYSYSDKKTTTSNSNSLAGWTLYDTTVSTGSWSGWTAGSKSSTDALEVENATLYRWYTFKCPSCGLRTPHWTDSVYNIKCYNCGGNVPEGSYEERLFKTNPNNVGDWYHDRKVIYVDGLSWFFVKNSSGAAYYRTRTKTYVYHFYQWTDYTPWSDTKVTENENRKVNTRTVYKYRKK